MHRVIYQCLNSILMGSFWCESIWIYKFYFVDVFLHYYKIGLVVTFDFINNKLELIKKIKFLIPSHIAKWRPMTNKVSYFTYFLMTKASLDKMCEHDLGEILQ